MFRAILKTTRSFQVGPDDWTVTKTFKTVEFECPALEAALADIDVVGNNSEITHFEGIEMIPTPPETAQNERTDG